METFLNLLLATLISTGFAVMLSDYAGPGNLFAKLRSSRIGKLFECPTCLVPYLSLIPVLGLGMTLWQYLAVVGAGIIVTRHA